jgi:protein-disulfide isomerase
VSARRPALLAAAAALLLAGCGGSGSKEASTTTQAAAPAGGMGASVAHVRGELDRIAQRGLLLGRPSAGVQIIEYASLDCDACARVHRAVVPAVIADYVRPGVASFEFRSVADTARSEQLALGAYAASKQRHGWEFIQLAFLRSAAAGGDTPAGLARALGLDGPRFGSDLHDPEWPRLLKGAVSVVRVAGFTGDPVFLVRRAGQPFTVLTEPTTLGQFTRAIAAAQRGHA